ncbi:MAG: DUF1932 domain-containing protein [Armatimonadota bacterium]|nr:DUF1932 domain-containing protein [Armatimonadota bacterium]MDR7487134.1 DUF1932 domain-containing protein [Armatimonadota bacterium]MDR7535022.1 DUF1932 domain-containing protein [Armatimonadota bacterium]
METSRLRIGFLGFGEAAKTFASALNGRVARLTAYCNGPRHRPPYTSAFQEEAAARGVTLVDSLEALVTGADLIISAVATSAATAVAEESALYLGARHIYADMNAVPPAAKDAMAQRVTARGAAFVDAELMGAVSLYGHTVAIYASGNGAAAFQQRLAPLGLNITVVPGSAGAAAFLKMLRSAVTKGMEALIVEAMFAAYRAGLAPEAFAALTQPMDAVRFSDFARMCLTSDPVHAGRRADEMKGVTAVIRQLGVRPTMAEATRRRLQWSARLGVKDLLSGREPEDFLAVLALYDQRDRAKTRPGGDPC